MQLDQKPADNKPGQQRQGYDFHTLTGWLCVRVCLGVMSILWGTGTAFAVEVNNMRLGDDYKIFNLPKGGTYKTCEKSCRDEKTCKAWTFIKERINTGDVLRFNDKNSPSFGKPGEKVLPAQCRLQTVKGSAYKNKCCISGLKSAGRALKESGSGFLSPFFSSSKKDVKTVSVQQCRKLANRSVDQYKENQNNSCGLSGKGWSRIFTGHFNSCKRVGDKVFARGVVARDAALRKCVDDNPEITRICKDFAKDGVRKAAENRKEQCGYTGQDWEKAFEAQFKACQRLDNIERERVMRQREIKMTTCLARKGKAGKQKKVAVLSCSAFARQAVNDYKANAILGCGFSGDRWNGDFKRHQTYCGEMSNWRKHLEVRARAKAIKLCANGRPIPDFKVAASSKLAKTPGTSKTPRTSAKTKFSGQKPVVVVQSAADRAACQRFVKDALKLQKQNQQFKCGYNRYTRWHSDTARHLSYCEKLGTSQRRNELAIRQEAIKRCIIDGPEKKVARKDTPGDQSAGSAGVKTPGTTQHVLPSSGTQTGPQQNERPAQRVDMAQRARFCKNYAETARRQVVRNRKIKCGQRGPLWLGDYSDHLKWCLKAPAGKPAKRLALRKAALNLCENERLAGRQSETGSSIIIDPDIAEDVLPDTPEEGADLVEKRRREKAARAEQRRLAEEKRRREAEEQTRRKKLAEQARQAEQERLKALERIAENERLVEQERLERQRREKAEAEARRLRRLAEERKTERICSQYARDTIRDVRKAKQNRCRVEGTLWRDDRAFHKRICMRLTPASREKYSRRRRNVVKKCLALRMDQSADPEYRDLFDEGLRDQSTSRRKSQNHKNDFDAYSNTGNCNTFAKKAVRQYLRAEASGCRLLDRSLWHGKLARYRRECRQMTPLEREDEAQEREIFLKRCERRSKRDRTGFSRPRPERKAMQVEPGNRCYAEAVIGIGYHNNKRIAMENMRRAWRRGAWITYKKRTTLAEGRMVRSPKCKLKPLFRRRKPRASLRENIFEAGHLNKNWSCAVMAKVCR